MRILRHVSRFWLEPARSDSGRKGAQPGGSCKIEFGIEEWSERGEQVALVLGNDRLFFLNRDIDDN